MSKKFWLGFGGVQIQLVDKFGRSQAATFETAKGEIMFEAVYRYKATDIDYNMKNKFLGYRVVINVANMVNAWSGDSDNYQSLIAMINLTNQQRTMGYRWNIIPKYSTDSGAINYNFRDYLLESDFRIVEPEMFKCFQDLALTFVSRKLTREIPNIFDEYTYVPKTKYNVTEAAEFIGWNSVAVRMDEPYTGTETETATDTATGE